MKELEDNESSNLESKPESVIIKKSTSNGLIIGIVIAVGIAAFFAGLYVSNTSSDQISQKELDDALDRLELRLLQGELPAQQPTGPLKISVDDDPMLGNPDAPITIIEFSDFQCPFCAKFHVDTLPQLKEEYISTGKVNFVYRDFPIQSIHPNAVPAALASECADDQGKFWEMHDMIFKNMQIWKDLPIDQSVVLFKQYAFELVLDSDEFDSCMDSGKHLDEIRKDFEDGSRYGVSGTPGFFVGNDDIGFTKLIGAQPFSSFQRVIDGQLNG